MLARKDLDEIYKLGRILAQDMLEESVKKGTAKDKNMHLNILKMASIHIMANDTYNASLQLGKNPSDLIQKISDALESELEFILDHEKKITKKL